jgi:hypothetical protein
MHELKKTWPLLHSHEVAQNLSVAATESDAKYNTNHILARKA